MTADALLVVRCLFTTIWSLLTSWHIPGTAVSPAMWAMFSLFFVFIVKFVIPRLLNLDFSGTISSHSRSSEK